MKWKDSGENTDQEEKTKEKYFDEEQYSPWADRKDRKKSGWFDKTSLIPVLLAVALIASAVALLMILMGGGSDSDTRKKLQAMEKRLNQLEERLDKFEAIDEKVTRIWEQAKSFEKFKDRFNRSEASMSLRMDHITMSLETLQKQMNKTPTKSQAKTEHKVKPAVSTAKVVYHVVKKGETLYSIGKQYGLKADEVRKLNKMTAQDVIRPGQKLIVKSAN